MRKFLLAITFLLMACAPEETPIPLSQIPYENRAPISVVEDSISQVGNGFSRQIDFRYLTQFGDTLDISVLEFKSDVYALDYYMNSGRFQGIHPIIRGEFMEQSIRSDARIFVFRHDSFRRYERSQLENYVRSFPGYRAGFPQEFLSLPFEHRLPGRTSIQTQNFFGGGAEFPVLIQSYGDGALRWNVARSWDVVEADAYERWTRQLHRVEPKGIAVSRENVYFRSGDGTNAMATLLPGGRVVCLWGYLDWFDLERLFFIAADRVFESRY